MLLALLSPAKRLNFAGAASLPARATQPALLAETAVLAARAKRYTKSDLRKLMDISPALAELNYKRFQAFDPKNGGETRPAIRAFAGDVYMGFDAKSLSDDDLTFAQSHIGILSGLYGILRPFDLIQAYRLEMGSGVTTPRGKDLYAFWHEFLTAHVNAVTAKMKAPVIVNLASDEYWSALDVKALKAPVVEAVFHEMKNGKGKIVSFLAKKARGLMARYIVQHRLNAPEEIKGFDTAGYAFDAKASTEARMVFSRKAVPPMAAR